MDFWEGFEKRAAEFQTFGKDQKGHASLTQKTNRWGGGKDGRRFDEDYLKELRERYKKGHNPEVTIGGDRFLYTPEKESELKEKIKNPDGPVGMGYVERDLDDRDIRAAERSYSDIGQEIFEEKKRDYKDRYGINV